MLSVLTENTYYLHIYRFCAHGALILFYISALSSFVSNESRLLRHSNRNTIDGHIYIACKQRLSFHRHGKWGSQTQHYPSSSRLWPLVSELLSLMAEKTHALRSVFPAHRKMSSVFKGFFFKGLCELQCAWLVKWGLSLLCQLEAVQSFKYFAH